MGVKRVHTFLGNEFFCSDDIVVIYFIKWVFNDKMINADFYLLIPCFF